MENCEIIELYWVKNEQAVEETKKKYALVVELSHELENCITSPFFGWITQHATGQLSKTYVAYCVPAVSKEYLFNMPMYGGSFN